MAKIQVHYQGRIIGEYSEQDIRAKIDSQEITSFHRLSRDGKSFIHPDEFQASSQPTPTVAPQPTASVNWYYTRQGKICGPIPETQLNELLASDKIRDTERVCTETEKEWIVVRDFLAQRRGTSIKAILSVVFGISWLLGIGSIVALALGILGARSGKKLWWVGIIGIVLGVIGLIVTIFILIPALLDQETILG